MANSASQIDAVVACCEVSTDGNDEATEYQSLIYPVDTRGVGFELKH